MSAGRIVPLDPRESVFTRRSVPVLVLDMGQQLVHQLVDAVMHEGLLAARTPHCVPVHVHSVLW